MSSSKIPGNNDEIADMVVQVSVATSQVSVWSLDLPWLPPVAQIHACEMSWDLYIIWNFGGFFGF